MLFGADSPRADYNDHRIGTMGGVIYVCGAVDEPGSRMTLPVDAYENRRVVSSDITQPLPLPLDVLGKTSKTMTLERRALNPHCNLENC